MAYNPLLDKKLKSLFSVINMNKPEFGTVNIELVFHQGDLRKASIMKTVKMLFNASNDIAENDECNEK